MRNLLLALLDAVDWLLTKQCVASHKYKTDSRECWECGYACKKKEA